MPARGAGNVLVLAALAALTLCGAAPGAGAADQTFGSTVWKTLKIGGGGWLTGIDISANGSVRVVRTDTYGAYRWSEPERQWKQLVTAQSMPAGDVAVDSGGGVYEIRVAPGLSGRMYMAYGGYVYRSDDFGAHWRRTALPRTAMDANDAFRTYGPKMAVDPANPDVVYFGAPQGGLMVTTDGGRNWRQAPQTPASEMTPEKTFPGFAGVAFDPDSGMISGKTRTILAAIYGHGVYRSSDAGASWAELPGSPRDITRAKFAKDGSYYAVADKGASLWRYASSEWANITPKGASARSDWSTIAVDPSHPARVLAVEAGGSFFVSGDRGDSWDDGAAARGMRREARDVPWLGWTQESYMSVGDMTFDPVVPNLLWFAEGIGVWQARLSEEETAESPLTFVSQTAGIEQLVANQIVAPSGGKPVLASWDRPVFRVENPDAYPARHSPDNERAIVMGWALDYAPRQPEFVAGLFNWWGVEKSGVSPDGGRNWTRFAAVPPTTANGKIGGAIAVSTAANMVWAPSNNANPYFTLDGGRSWKPVDIPGVPRQGDTGWGAAYYLNRRIVAADRVSPGVFYIYNSHGALYRTPDGGVHWALAHEGEIAPFSGYNAQLRAAPGHSGHLFFTSGPQGAPNDPHPAQNPFMRSNDGGVTWTPVEGVLEARAFGFGKGRGAYPAIYVVGWVDGRYGIWSSQDNAATWKQIGDFPLGILDRVATIEGDGDVAGRVYVGFGGAGYVYGQTRP